MNLVFNTSLASSYISNSQIAKVLTEKWVEDNSYCPNCGQENVSKFEANRPVADFFCAGCDEEFELKSKKGKLGNKINDSAYVKMLERITSENNPNFFFLTYNNANFTVNDFLIIPKQFFVPEIIEPRKPLGPNAKRAGWVGCNINLQKIPELGRIFLVKNSVITDKNQVRKTWNATVKLRNKSIETKGWTLDVLRCIDQINSDDFMIGEVYKFEEALKLKHPDNNHVKDKIRQQLQVLRDLNIIEFVSRGKYKKVIK
jgi:type II restriction enzyme